MIQDKNYKIFELLGHCSVLQSFLLQKPFWFMLPQSLCHHPPIMFWRWIRKGP